jgi:hypothetical protein
MHQRITKILATRAHPAVVRLHALKDYYGMVALLREFPGVRMTFNLVPSLLVQPAFAEGHARDRFLKLSSEARRGSRRRRRGLHPRELLSRPAQQAHDRRLSGHGEPLARGVASQRLRRGAGRRPHASRSTTWARPRRSGTSSFLS